MNVSCFLRRLKNHFHGFRYSFSFYLRSVNVTRQQQQPQQQPQQQQPQQRKGEQKGQQKGVQRGEQGGVQREVLERLLGDSLVALFGSVGAGSIQASLLVLSCDPCGPHSVAVLRCDKRHEQQVWAAAAAMRHPTLNPSVQVVTLASSLLALANPTLHLPTP
ncbi:unnamed protein product [Closterium sp. NIES-64]|nr:unnamed protein product [Closterium sp. NIES-64]CAI5954431.1 unnamed protein product [Closterium sp. NIES-64]